MPEDRLIVAESGLFTPDDLADLARYGARCFLIGEGPDAAGRCRAAATRAILANPLTAHGRRMTASGLTHFDAKGAAHMVDVSAKPVTDRIAVAEGYVVMAPETLALITEGRAKKGDVLSVARLAGIMGAKKTASLIPLCHPLADHQGRAGPDRRPRPKRRAGRGHGQDRRPDRGRDGGADRRLRRLPDGL